MTIIGGHNCVPGERLGSQEEYEGGRGTYIRQGTISFIQEGVRLKFLRFAIF